MCFCPWATYSKFYTAARDYIISLLYLIKNVQECFPLNPHRAHTSHHVLPTGRHLEPVLALSPSTPAALASSWKPTAYSFPRTSVLAVPSTWKSSFQISGCLPCYLGSVKIPSLLKLCPPWCLFLNFFTLSVI